MIIKAYAGNRAKLFGKLDAAHMWLFLTVEQLAAGGWAGASGWSEQPDWFTLTPPLPGQERTYRVRIRDQWGEPIDLGPFKSREQAEHYAAQVDGVLVVEGDPDPCECDGIGYFASFSDGEGRWHLERCDQCRKFADDNAAAGQWAWDLSHGLPWAVEAARTLLGGAACS